MLGASCFSANSKAMQGRMLHKVMPATDAVSLPESMFRGEGEMHTQK